MPESPPSPATPEGKRRRLPLRGLFLFSAAICLITVLLWAALPHVAGTMLIPAAAAKLGLPGLDVEIRHAGPMGLDLGTVSLGPDAGIRIEAVQADWSPAGLLAGRVDRVRVMGLRVTVVESDGHWSVRGLPVMEEGDGQGRVFLPEIGRMSVEGRLDFTGIGTALSVPFSLDGSLKESGALALEVRAEPAGQKLALSLDGDLRQREFRLTCALPPASIAALAAQIPGLRDMPVSGTVQARADAALSADGQTELRAGLGLESVRALLGDSLVAQQGNATARLDWQEVQRLDLEPVRLTAPLPLVLTVRDIALDPEAQALDCAWDLELPSLPGLDLAAPAVVNGAVAVRRKAPGWAVNVRGDIAPLELRAADLPETTIKAERSPFLLDISTGQGKTRLDASINPGRVRASHGETGLVLSGQRLTCNATVDAAGTRGVFDFSGARLGVTRPDLSLNTTRLQTQGAFILGERTELTATVRTALAARSGDASVAASLSLPLAWPEPAAEAGRAAVDVNWKKKPLARFSSRVAQNLRGAAVNGALEIRPLGVRAAVSGLLDVQDMRGTRAEATVDQDLALPAGLAALAPALADLAGSARLKGTARLDMSRGVPVVPVDLKLTNLDLTHKETKATLAGGALDIAFADLLSTRSNPDQRLTFETLQLGTVVLQKGDVRFQVEGPHSVLVEGCAFRWAGGRIGTQAFRVNPGVEDYTVEMYCDRVDLARALEQFGMTQVHGGGTANGRIPVRWADGALTFDDGFLYSTPGEKGVLRVLGTEILTAGVPPGTPQYGQLDLASEALKDFAYEWAKVTMNTEGRELIVSLQLDGKPEKPLPFIFDRDVGGFARVSTNSPGSVFQGIRLDVNFRLPLDQLLQYRQILELMNNGG
jgi:hypothetical protein